MTKRSEWLWMPPARPAWWLVVLLPLTAVAAASLIVMGLRLAFPSSSRFVIVYVLPVAVSAYWSGRTAGLVATLLTVISATYISLPPEFQFALSPNALPAAALLAAICLIMVYGADYLRALVLEGGRRYLEEQTRARQQAAVSQIGRLSLLGGSLTELMDAIVNRLSATLEVEYAKILELLPGGDALILRSGVGWRQGLVGYAIVPAANSQAGYALAERRPVIVSDLGSETRFVGPALLFDHGVVSGMSVIIEGPEEGKPYGVLGVHTRRQRRFTDDDVNFLQLVADVLSISLQRRAAEAALQENEERLRIAVEAGQLGAWDWDIRTSRVTWSPQLEMIHGLEPGGFGGSFEDFQQDIHPDDRERVLRAIADAVRTAVPYEIEYRIVAPDGDHRWLAARGVVLRDGEGQAVRMIGVCRDITARKHADAERERLLEQEQEARLESEQARDRLAFLADASTVLASTLDYKQTLFNVSSIAVPRFADWCAVDLLDDDQQLKTVAIRHTDPQKIELARELQRRIPYDPDAIGGPARVVRTGQPELYAEVPEELMTPGVQDTTLRESVRALGLRSAIIVPLIARGRTLGTFSFVTAESGRSYGPSDLELATELASRAALFVDNARLYERERRIAVTLQQAFLPPDLPPTIGLQIDAAYLPAAAEAEVGGDWYDAFRLQDGRIVVSLGDVAGRGLKAAVSMGLIRQAIRAAAYEDHDPAMILARAGHLLELADEDAMATAIVGLLDPTTMVLVYAGAGHPAPLLVLPDGGVRRLPAAGVPLGVRGREPSAAVHEVHLDRGTLLVLYTDGLIELDRRPVDGESALVEALRRGLAEGSPHPARAILDRLLADRLRHDDAAVLTLAVAPSPLAGFDVTYPAIPSTLPLIRQAIEQLTQAAGLEPERTSMLQIAVGEAVNNTIEHAYALSPGTVRARTRIEESGLVVEIQDSGQWRTPRVDRGGRGLRLMRALVDDVKIERTDGGTTVRLRLNHVATTGGRAR